MVKRVTMTEAEMAKRVVCYLEDEGYAVYEEVQLADWGGPRADIVATKNDRITVIEAKQHLSFELIAQAKRWQKMAHKVLIAVPHARRSAGRDCALSILAMLGIGMLEVTSLWPLEDERGLRSVRQVVEPMFKPSCSPELAAALRPEHQTHAKAGTNSGGFVTRFSITCASVRTFLVDNPGATLRQALLNVDHHYASANSGVAAITKWAANGTAPGLRVDENGAVVAS